MCNAPGERRQHQQGPALDVVMGLTASANTAVEPAVITAEWLNGYKRNWGTDGQRRISFVLSSALCACSGDPTLNNMMNVDANLTTDISTRSDVPVPVRKTHHYKERDGSNHEYVSAVSEEDAKKGQVVGDVVLFAFRGAHAGLYRLSMIDDDGANAGYYECANPCAIIRG